MGDINNRVDADENDQKRGRAGHAGKGRDDYQYNVFELAGGGGSEQQIGHNLRNIKQERTLNQTSNDTYVMILWVLPT